MHAVANKQLNIRVISNNNNRIHEIRNIKQTRIKISKQKQNKCSLHKTLYPVSVYIDLMF